LHQASTHRAHYTRKLVGTNENKRDNNDNHHFRETDTKHEKPFL